MATYVGVDGCRAGWFAVTLSGPNQSSFELFDTIGTLWSQHKKAERILIDVPIGLPEQGQRACDTAARRVLRGRRNSVFSVPVRPAIYASAYAEANEINRRINRKKLSKQLWNITPKIREVDSLLRNKEEARSAFYESHPEVVFWGMVGNPMQHNKKTRAGLTERLETLERFRPGISDVYEEALSQYRRRDVSRDDVVDALVLAVAAYSGNLLSLPETPETDALDLPMRIVYVQPPRVLRLHHAQITIPVGAEDQARAFYCGLLGMQEIAKPEALAGRGGFWVALGSLQIHIGTEDGVNRQATKAHLAYHVSDINHWRKVLQNEGIEIDSSVPIPGFERFEFRDPFGNRVEFIQPIPKKLWTSEFKSPF